jgi:hypothetical protein
LIPAIEGLVDAKPLGAVVAAVLPLLVPPFNDEAVEEMEDKAAKKKKKEQEAQVEVRQKELGEVLAAIARRATNDTANNEDAATNAAAPLVLFSPYAPAIESLYEKTTAVGHSAGSNVGEVLWAAVSEAKAATGTPPPMKTLVALCLGNLNSTETRLGVVTALLQAASATAAAPVEASSLANALSEASSELLKSKECAPLYLVLLQAHLPAVEALLLNSGAASGAADDDESTKKAGVTVAIAFGAKLLSAVHRHRKENATRSAGLAVLMALFSQQPPATALLLPATAATVTQLAETAAASASSTTASSGHEGMAPSTASSSASAEFLLNMAEALTAGGALKASLTKKVLLCALDALKYCPGSSLVATSTATLVSRAPAKELKSKDVGARKEELEDAVRRRTPPPSPHTHNSKKKKKKSTFTPASLC